MEIYLSINGNDNGSGKFEEPIKSLEEAVRRMIIYGPTDWNYSDKPLKHREIVGPFRDNNPDLYVSETMP